MVGLLMSSSGVASSRSGRVTRSPSSGSPAYMPPTPTKGSPRSCSGSSGITGSDQMYPTVESSSGASATKSRQPARTRAASSMRVGDVELEDLGPEAVEAELEPRDDAEVAAAAADRPVAGRRARGRSRAPGGRRRGRARPRRGCRSSCRGVALPRHAAAEREAGDARLGDDAAGRGQPERLVTRSTSAQVAPPSTSTVRPYSLMRTVRIAERSMTRPSSTTAVPATLWPPPRTASGTPCSAARAHRRGDVVGVGAARDHGGAAVDHAVPHAARGVVVGVVRRDDVAREALGERGGDGGAIEGGLDGHEDLLWERKVDVLRPSSRPSAKPPSTHRESSAPARHMRTKRSSASVIPSASAALSASRRSAAARSGSSTTAASA